MFSLSAKSLYGLLALVYLARKKGESVQIREIADSHSISQNYLEQLLLVLRKAGVLKSQRGINGGYFLARPPETISVLEVLESLEGSIEILRERVAGSELDFLWDLIASRIRKVLSLSLRELVESIDARTRETNYVI